MKESTPTLRTLAKSLNLSVTTVSRALKDGQEVKQATRDKVKKAASELGYVPNLGGVKLKTGKSFALYAALSSWQADEVGEMGTVSLIQGIQDVLSDTPYHLVALSLDPSRDDIDELKEVVAQGAVDGFILDMTRLQDKRVKYLNETNIPFVTFGRTELYSPHPHFDVDDEAAAWESTAYLLNKGHRNIALFCADAAFSFAAATVAGFKKAHKQAGFDFKEAQICHFSLDAKAARAYVKQLCAKPDRPTAMLSPNEVVTLGLVAGLRDIGLEPNKDVEIISRDGTALTNYLYPPIASSFYPLRKTGNRLAELLLRRLDGEPVESLQEVVKTTLLER